MTEDGDIKELLGQAFGPEPPIALDRDAVVQRGRRKVRLRRVAASGGVAASVTAVVVGAAMIAGLSGPGAGEDVATPAYGGTDVSATTTAEAAPAGPQLPLNTSMAPSGMEPSTSDGHAQLLTKVFAEANLIPSSLRVQAIPNRRVALVFTQDAGSYLAIAELVDQLGTGTLTISVSWHPPGSTPAASCAEWSPPSPISCTVIDESGVPVRVGSYRDAAGRITYDAHAERPGVTSVFVGITSAAAAPAKPNARPKPPLEPEVLVRIAALPGLTYS